MKSRIAIVKCLMLSLPLLLLTAPADAAPVLFGWGGEKIVKVMDLPDEPLFQTPDGVNVDVGYRYQQVTIFFVPVWNYNGTLCGYVGLEDQYLDLDRETLSGLAQLAGLDLPESPSLSAWDSYGGKAVILLVVLLYFGARVTGGTEDEEEPVTTYREPGVSEPRAA